MSQTSGMGWGCKVETCLGEGEGAERVSVTGYGAMVVFALRCRPNAGGEWSVVLGWGWGLDTAWLDRRV